jgi:sporulation protein YlmC with PRC-barrel domain
MKTDTMAGGARAEMDIPIGAEVFCDGALCGRSTYVVVDPTPRRVTHVVVRETAPKGVDRLVPVANVQEATQIRITLGCTAAELTAMPRFTETEYVRSDVPFFAYGAGDYVLWPYYDPPVPVTLPVEHRHVPKGEEAIPQGAEVRAMDGPVGRVDEFQIDPAEGRITHLVMRKGHLWGQRDVVLPVDEIDRVKGGIVHLRLSKAEIATLPGVPVPRKAS